MPGSGKDFIIDVRISGDEYSDGTRVGNIRNAISGAYELARNL